MKLRIYTSLISVAAIASSSAALYTSDFNSFAAPPTEIAGQDGWAINDPGNLGTLSFGVLLAGSQGLGIGGTYGETTTPSISLSHDFVESVGRVSARFDFSFEDSDEAFVASRDTFGFSLNGSSGKLFEVSFVPVTQSPTPSTTTGQWSAFYSVNGAPNIELANTDLDEAGAFTFDLTLGGFFTPGNTTTTNFVLRLASGGTVLTRTGSVALDPQTATTGFAFNYAATDGVGFNGTNALLVDNLTVVPEPSSALLLALTSLGLVSRRRRA